MASQISKTNGVRLKNSTWAALDWVAKEHPKWNRGNAIEAALKPWLAQFPIPDEVTQCEGQMELFDLDEECETPTESL